MLLIIFLLLLILFIILILLPSARRENPEDTFYFISVPSAFLLFEFPYTWWARIEDEVPGFIRVHPRNPRLPSAL
jgi:hypothetical protein